MGSHRVRHDWSDLAAAAATLYSLQSGFAHIPPTPPENRGRHSHLSSFIVRKQAQRSEVTCSRSQSKSGVQPDPLSPRFAFSPLSSLRRLGWWRYHHLHLTSQTWHVGSSITNLFARPTLSSLRAPGPTSSTSSKYRWLFLEMQNGLTLQF